MKLKSFKIKNYKSIQDTGEVKLDTGRIAIFAGQNESGKSAMLEALNAFEQASFGGIRQVKNRKSPCDQRQLSQEKCGAAQTGIRLYDPRRLQRPRRFVPDDIQTSGGPKIGY